MIKIRVTDRSGVVHNLSADTGTSVMEVIRDSGLEIEAICGGGCSCATCHVYVDEEWMSALGLRGDTEAALLDTSFHFKPQASRLSCQIQCIDVLDGLSLKVAPED